MKGGIFMDFLKLNNEFQNLQKQFENSERYSKGINNNIKKLDKSIAKLEQKNETEKDVIQKSINNLLIEIKKDFKRSLEEITLIDNKE